MGDAVVGRESVGEHIDLLEARYGDFSVNQTTVTVPADGYDRARDRIDAGLIDAYVRVWNDEGEAFHMRCEQAFGLSQDEGTLEASVRAAVREATGVDAVVEDVSRVTIAGIRNEDEPEAPALYRLFVLFDANHASGTPDDLEWEADASAVPEFVSSV